MPYIISTTTDERFFLKSARIKDDPLSLYRKETRHSANNGVRIPDHAAPKGFYAKSKAKGTPDFFAMFSEIAVSDRFKDIVEDLEPGVHQFFPVKGVHPDTGEPRTLDCYIFNCCNQVDGGFVEPQEKLKIEERIFLPNHKITIREHDQRSTCESDRWSYHISYGHPYLLSKDRVGDKHCWIDKRYNARLFISDDLYAALVAHNIQAALQDPEFFPIEGKDYGEGA